MYTTDMLKQLKLDLVMSYTGYFMWSACNVLQGLSLPSLLLFSRQIPTLGFPPLLTLGSPSPHLFRFKERTNVLMFPSALLYKQG